MEASTPSTLNLSPELYDHLVHTLTAMLPPPVDDSHQALPIRNQAAIAKVASLLPVNANEADLAAQCVAARAQADHLLRLVRTNEHDIALMTRLNGQYTSTVRQSASVHRLLMRVQAVRRKRDAIEATATEDAWTQHIVEQSMLKVADPPMEPVTPAQPEAAPEPRPDQGINENVPKNNTNSHGVAFETWMSERPWTRSGDAVLRKRVGEAMDAGLRLVWQGQQEQGIAESVSKDNPNSHGVAFETWLREKPWSRPDKTDLRQRVYEAMVAEMRTAWQELSADGRADPVGTDPPIMPTESPNGREAGIPN